MSASALPLNRVGPLTPMMRTPSSTFTTTLGCALESIVTWTSDTSLLTFTLNALCTFTATNGSVMV